MPPTDFNSAPVEPVLHAWLMLSMVITAGMAFTGIIFKDNIVWHLWAAMALCLSLGVHILRRTVYESDDSSNDIIQEVFFAYIAGPPVYLYCYWTYRKDLPFTKKYYERGYFLPTKKNKEMHCWRILNGNLNKN